MNAKLGKKKRKRRIEQRRRSLCRRAMQIRGEGDRLMDEAHATPLSIIDADLRSQAHRLWCAAYNIEQAAPPRFVYTRDSK